MLKMDIIISMKILDLFKIFLGVFILSPGLGFIFHQTNITLFSPYYGSFLQAKFFKVEREIFYLVPDIKNTNPENITFKLLPPNIDFSSKSEIFAFFAYVLNRNKDNELLKQELANRYSYYYARVESGLISSILSFILVFSFFYFVSIENVNWLKSMNLYILIPVLIILIISILMLSFCPKLLREINSLEKYVIYDLLNEDLVSDEDEG